MHLLFLYTEISGYFLACAAALAREAGAQVTIVRWEVNAEAPFQFETPPGLRFVNRRDLDDAQLLALAQQLNPSLIYVAGRVDKGYLAVARALKPRGIPILFGFDNHWIGSLRQQVAAWLSPFLIRNRFTHAFIPGEPQMKFARKMGFSDNQILTGVYAGDIDPFLSASAAIEAHKAQAWPHRLLFCGRLVESKGVPELIAAFRSLSAAERGDWRLQLCGTGPLTLDLKPDEPIEATGFVQPAALPALVAGAGAFVLPSRFEPWGVALHECAAGGLPLIASTAVGASTAFLKEGINGWTFPAGDREALRRALAQLFSTADDKLIAMGAASRELSQQLSPRIWAQTLMKLLR